MSDEVVLAARMSGTVVDLNSDQDCFLAIREIRQLEAQLRDVKRQVTQAMVARYQQLGGPKTRVIEGCGKVTLKGGPTVRYDPDLLERGLLEAGMPSEAVAEVVFEVVERRVDAIKARQAASANPQYASAVAAAASTVEASWTVDVT